MTDYDHSHDGDAGYDDDDEDNQDNENDDLTTLIAKKTMTAEMIMAMANGTLKNLHFWEAREISIWSLSGTVIPCSKNNPLSTNILVTYILKNQPIIILSGG